jgi:sugar phosphate permease
MMASLYDIGAIMGAVLLGFLTDLTYSRRAPLSALFLFGATLLQSCLIHVGAD